MAYEETYYELLLTLDGDIIDNDLYSRLTIIILKRTGISSSPLTVSKLPEEHLLQKKHKKQILQNSRCTTHHKKGR